MTQPNPANTLFDPVNMAPEPLPVPLNNDHAQRVKDLESLWSLGLKEGRRAEMMDIFNKHQGLGGDETLSRSAQYQIRVLLKQPVPLEAAPFTTPLAHTLALPAPLTLAPQPLVSVTQQAPQPPAPEVDQNAETLDNGDLEETGNPADEIEVEEDSADETQEDQPGEDADEESTDEEPADATSVEEAEAASVTTEPTSSHNDASWPEGTQGNGLISTFARTLGVGDLMQIVINRISSTELSISVVPHKIADESEATSSGFTAVGTPAILDEEMLESAPVYVEARMTVREAVQAMRERNRKAVENAKTTQSKQVPTTAAQHAGACQANITVNVKEHPKALSHLTNEKGGKIDLTPGKAARVDAGAYTLNVTVEGFKPHSEKLALKAKETKTIEVNLTRIFQSTLL